MPPIDEYGIEYDGDVEAALKDPKSTLLSKLLDYRDARKKKQQEKADADEAEKKKKEKVSVFPW
jgi:hypothetical protein